MSSNNRQEDAGMSRLFSLGQTAKEPNVSIDTIRRLALEQGKLRHVRVASRIMIPRTEIDRVVREGTRNTRPKKYRKVPHARPSR
jgi:hypothetical protein